MSLKKLMENKILNEKMKDVYKKMKNNEYGAAYESVRDILDFINKKFIMKIYNIDLKDASTIPALKIYFEKDKRLFEYMLSLNDYYRTGIHWGQEKIVDVASYLVEEMNHQYVNKKKKEKTFTPFYGSLYGQAALPIQPDTITYLTNDTLESIQVWNFEKQKMEPVYQPNSENIDSYDLFLSGPTPLLEIENPNQETGELIIFRDSFASSLTPLIIESYHHITLIDLRYISTNLLENLVDFTDKDILFLYSVPVINQSSILK